MKHCLLFNFQSLVKPFHLLARDFFYFFRCFWPLKFHAAKQLFTGKDSAIAVITYNFNPISFPVTKEKDILIRKWLQVKLHTYNSRQRIRLLFGTRGPAGKKNLLGPSNKPT